MRQEWCELGEHGELTRDAVEWFEESGHIHYRGHRRELLDVAGPHLIHGLAGSAQTRP